MPVAEKRAHFAWPALRAVVALTFAMFISLLSLALVPVSAHAANQDSGTGSEEGPLSLTVRYETETGFVGNELVAIYRVADVADDGSVVPVPELAVKQLNWEMGSSSSMQTLAHTLESYLMASEVMGWGLSPADFAYTNANGVASFPSVAGVLEKGLYLVVADPASDEDGFCEPASVLIALPYVHEDGASDPSPNVDLKLRYASADQTVTLDALKLWEGKNSKQPDSVTVHLLCDGELKDTVELNSSNGWHASWDGLSAAHKWTVVEGDVPKDYLVSIKRDGFSYSVANAFVGEDVAEDAPSREKLPQTGMMWWPVPVLLLAGAACVGVGLSRRRNG